MQFKEVRPISVLQASHWWQVQHGALVAGDATLRSSTPPPPAAHGKVGRHLAVVLWGED